MKNNYKIECPHCHNIHIEFLTENAFKNGKFKKYCSSTCAHFKSKTTKIKISKTLSLKNTIKICKHCKNKFNSTINHSQKYCSICLWNLKHKNSKWFLNQNNQKVCKICGSLEIEHKCLSICSKPKLIEFLNHFNFNKNVIGNLNQLKKELQRIKTLCYKEYYINFLSFAEISKKYEFKGYGNLSRLFKIFNFKLRNFSEAEEVNFIKRKHKSQKPIKKFHSGYHITWKNEKIFLRSSYEFNYAKLLDEQKINYESESLRIKYWDTQKQKFRIAIPDFYLKDQNEIIEIKSTYTLNKQNIKDKFNAYQKLGYKTKLILEGKEIKI